MKETEIPPFINATNHLLNDEITSQKLEIK
jgi:hypothetical protein